MNEHLTPDIRFDGLGVTARDAAEASRALAAALDTWSGTHPGRRIVTIKVQSAAIGAELHLTAIIAYLAKGPRVATAEAAHEEAVEQSAAVAVAEEIVAEAQQED